MTDLSEKQIQDFVLELLKVHPKVAWASRVNVGAVRRGGRYIRFGERGMSDITGQLKDGRRLEVELKRPSGKTTPEQDEFIERVKRWGGVAFVARNCGDVMEALAQV